MNEDEQLPAKAPCRAVSDVDLRDTINALMAIVRHPKSNFRSRTAAARVLAVYKRLDVDADRHDMLDRLDALEERSERSQGT